MGLGKFRRINIRFHFSTGLGSPLRSVNESVQTSWPFWINFVANLGIYVAGPPISGKYIPETSTRFTPLADPFFKGISVFF